jgi:hypothetical protein
MGLRQGARHVRDTIKHLIIMYLIVIVSVSRLLQKICINMNRARLGPVKGLRKSMVGCRDLSDPPAETRDTEPVRYRPPAGGASSTPSFSGGSERTNFQTFAK